MAPVLREVKFQEILRDLLDRSKTTVTQKKLAAAIGVSSTTVSHYITGRISPSFSALVGIAEFFNVTLDYLVFGERAQDAFDDGAQSLRTDVLRALAESNSFNGRQRDLTLRVSRRLYSQIEWVAKELLEDRENLGPAGFFTDSEALAIESCAQRTRVMLRTAPADIEVGEDGEAYPGVFFNTLATNIQAGRSYQYLFYGKRSLFAPYVRMYRELLSRVEIPSDVVRDRMDFRVIDSELPAGILIHDLDLAMFERREPILWERFRDDGIVNGVFAYVSIRHQDALGGIVLYGTYLDSVLKMFKRDWELASSL